jgi:hypothetical protein
MIGEHSRVINFGKDKGGPPDKLASIGITTDDSLDCTSMPFIYNVFSQIANRVTSYDVVNKKI